MAGRPPLYNTTEELENKIDEYFEKGVRTKTVVVGRGKDNYEVEIEIPTITGLCLYLGFESRQSFYDMEKNNEFSYTIKKARLRIENHYEELLQTGTPAAAIFALKNFNWTDKTEVEQTITDKSQKQVIEIRDYSKKK
jgi:hypothetical protein